MRCGTRDGCTRQVAIGHRDRAGVSPARSAIRDRSAHAEALELADDAAHGDAGTAHC